MKIAIIVICLSGVSRLCADSETVFTIRGLKGEMRIYTDEKGAVLPEPKIEATENSDPAFILKEKEGGQESYYVVHNNGRHSVIPIVGATSITFIESYGDNNFLWTVCLDRKNKDGSYLAIFTSAKPAGVLGLTTTSVMGGGAYTLLQPRETK